MYIPNAAYCAACCNLKSFKLQPKLRCFINKNMKFGFKYAEYLNIFELTATPMVKERPCRFKYAEYPNIFELTATPMVKERPFRKKTQIPPPEMLILDIPILIGAVLLNNSARERTREDYNVVSNKN